MPDWTLDRGQKIKRTELHRLFGGKRQGGISPSAQSPNVFVFSDSASGERHGYRDNWKTDGCFHYTGEGQRGDQRMVSGNRAILEAARDGRALRLFDGTGALSDTRASSRSIPNDRGMRQMQRKRITDLSDASLYFGSVQLTRSLSSPLGSPLR